MTVLEEILQWSTDRPAWQRDALRRLVLNGELAASDVADLTDICKGAHGLVGPREAVPLAREHIPATKAGAPPVSLGSIFHERGVNALAEDQTLKFSPGMTLVYGDNGAGKTGYIRILKGACRARGQERILGNVVSGRAPLAPLVSIAYQVGDEPTPRSWSGKGTDESISRVSVFDTKCAAVYLNERTDVAFLPFGLDLFDKLVQACKSVKAQLESEQRALGASTLNTVQSVVPQGTTVAKALSNVTSLTKPETIEALATLSDEERDRLSLVEQTLLDIQANDPAKLQRELRLRVGRARTLVTHLEHVEAVLSDAELAKSFNARDQALQKEREASLLREATFKEGALPGTGNDVWLALWQSARRFSREHAYPSAPFPVTDGSVQCVLCQQALDDTAASRLEHFEAFATSTTEQDLISVRHVLDGHRQALIALDVTSAPALESLEELAIDHQAEAAVVADALKQHEQRRVSASDVLSTTGHRSEVQPPLNSALSQARRIVSDLEARGAALQNDASDGAADRLRAEAHELRARTLLAEHKQIVLDDIERRKRYAAYGLCLEDTRATAITNKSSQVTKTTVSDRLKTSFGEELINLEFTHLEIELKEAGGTDGVFYHKLLLTRAPGVEVPQVVSEGEQRCISIAAFFAELSTADDPSAIVFDDPVSSLDFQWRGAVARRLVQESLKRQVIVFTHDVVFLLALKQVADELGVQPLDQHVRRMVSGAGVCVDELPWVAMPVSKKIGFLKNGWQAADKLYRTGQQDAYEKDAKYLYGLLREGWERGLEEVLLGGVVERYRPNVETQRLARIADIKTEDCRVVETAMTKCSTWLPGHDKAPAARAPVPTPDVLKADIERLETWVKDIRDRRK